MAEVWGCAGACVCVCVFACARVRVCAVDNTAWHRYVMNGNCKMRQYEYMSFPIYYVLNGFEWQFSSLQQTERLTYEYKLE